MNKREFIAAVGALAAASSEALAADAPQAESGAGSRRRLPPIEERPRLSAWRQYVGDEFALAGGARLRLREVVESGFSNARVEQFCLRFEQAAGPAAEPGLRTLRHASGQALALHLEAVDGDVLLAHSALLV